MSTVRLTITNETNSGSRRGWSKHVTSVDATKTNGYAFGGAFLRDATETDVPVGAVVVQVAPEGSVKRGWESAACYVVGSDGKLYTTDDERYHWHKQFLSFRDLVAKVLADPLSYLPEAAGGPPEEKPAPPAETPAAAPDPEPAPARPNPFACPPLIPLTVAPDYDVLDADRKWAAVDRIKALMAEHGVTLADLAD